MCVCLWLVVLFLNLFFYISSSILLDIQHLSIFTYITTCYKNSFHLSWICYFFSFSFSIFQVLCCFLATIQKNNNNNNQGAANTHRDCCYCCCFLKIQRNKNININIYLYIKIKENKRNNLQFSTLELIASCGNKCVHGYCYDIFIFLQKETLFPITATFFSALL